MKNATQHADVSTRVQPTQLACTTPACMPPSITRPKPASSSARHRFSCLRARQPGATHRLGETGAPSCTAGQLRGFGKAACTMLPSKRVRTPARVLPLPLAPWDVWLGRGYRSSVRRAV
jgi:hypothetical protein